MRLLILYTELADYFVSILNQFQEENPDTEIMLIHYPINPEAPFILNINPEIKSIEFAKNSRKSVENSIKEFKPNVVLCSGWANKFYLKQIFKLKVLSNTTNVLCFDNIWHNQKKQYLMLILSRLILKNLFKYLWVPGPLQKKYGMMLGFNSKNIFEGFYVANKNIYLKIGEKKLSEKGKFPRNFISVARYIPQKNLNLLFEAFIEANQLSNNKWKLNSLGQGILFDDRILNNNIEHKGFIQPFEMEEIIKNSGVFVLPSLFEPWAVSVHEMCMSALPLILSNKVGSSNVFLKNDNGFSFNPNSKKELVDILVKVMNLSDDELWQMSDKSFQNSKYYNNENWIKTLKDFFK